MIIELRTEVDRLSTLLRSEARDNERLRGIRLEREVERLRCDPSNLHFLTHARGSNERNMQGTPRAPMFGV